MKSHTDSVKKVNLNEKEYKFSCRRQQHLLKALYKKVKYDYYSMTFFYMHIILLKMQSYG